MITVEVTWRSSPDPMNGVELIQALRLQRRREQQMARWTLLLTTWAARWSASTLSMLW